MGSTNQMRALTSLTLGLEFKLIIGASLVAQMVKNLPAMQETQVRSLGWKDSLDMGMATHYSILAWRILYPLINKNLQ